METLKKSASFCMVSLEDYRGTEEVQVVLKRVESELLELNN